jgi:aminoglycoside phosphotransferase (APT) family kinase protein
MTVEAPGPLIGTGRSADVFDLKNGRVLRRYRDGRSAGSVGGEAQLMAHARAAGVPVPEVFDVSGTDIVMERVTGPTMLETLGRQPWTAGAHARLLARLHGLVHRVPASGLPDTVRPLPFGPPSPRESSVLLHRDLHPQNVLLTTAGPVIIDWEGAAYGPAVADVAMTWVIMGFSDVPAMPRAKALLVRSLQAWFTRAFVRAAGPFDADLQEAVVRARLADPHLLPTEAARLTKLLS